MTDAEHRIFINLTGRDRVELLDQASALRQQYRPCKQEACPPDCETCLSFMDVQVVRLMRGIATDRIRERARYDGAERGRWAVVERPVARPAETPDQVAERLRRRRGR